MILPIPGQIPDPEYIVPFTRPGFDFRSAIERKFIPSLKPGATNTSEARFPSHQPDKEWRNEQGRNKKNRV
jgi:hypothetical protein